MLPTIVSAKNKPESLTQLLFITFFILVLLSHSDGLQYGPFTWGAFLSLGSANTAVWRIGPLSLLPVLLAAGVAYQWLKARSSASWSWGRPYISVTMGIITLLAVVDIVLLRLFLSRQAISLVCFWLVYLWLINAGLNAEDGGHTLHFSLLWGITAVVIIQAGIGMAQFILQHDVGLQWLGEPVLDPAQSGISVIMNGETRWLRGYGLNSSPNRLGWKLALLVLVLWPVSHTLSKKQRWLVWTAVALGLAGIVVSLSRAAWLAVFAAGLIYAGRWLWQAVRQRRLTLSREKRLFIALTGGSFLVFLGLFGPMVAGRWSKPSNFLETYSVLGRVLDIELAFQIMQQSPWNGTNLGLYEQAIKEMHIGGGQVHVVPLWIGGQFGIPGLVLWTVFLVWPFLTFHLWRRYPMQITLWAALLIISMLQPEPDIFTLQGAVMLGLLAALWSAPAGYESAPVSPPEQVHTQINTHLVTRR